MPKLSKVERAINILEAAIKRNGLPEDQLSRIASLIETAKGTRPAVKDALLAAAENTALQAYGQQYDLLPDDIKQRCDWETVFAKLLENSGEKLRKASAMQGGGRLVDIGTDGKIVFRDKSVEPVMYGFGHGREGKLIPVFDRDPEQMAKIMKWANYSEIREQVHADGYELFATNGNIGLSDEMKRIQAHTKEPFVASKDRKEWRASHLESGDKPSSVQIVCFGPSKGAATVEDGFDPEVGTNLIGVARLLRV